MNSAGSEPALIGVDWGTTSLRAFLIDTNGLSLTRNLLPIWEKLKAYRGFSRGLGPAAAPRLSQYCNGIPFFLTPKARLKGRGVGFVVARQV